MALAIGEMKTRFYIIIAVTIIFSMYLLMDAPIYNDIQCMSGFEHSHFGNCQSGKFFEINMAFAEKSSLKQQLAENTPLSKISCPNENHVLSKRSNDKLVCVTPYTMIKMEWDSVDNSFWSIIIKNERQYGIFAHLSKTQKTESVKYSIEQNSVIVHMISDKPEKLSISVNRELLETPTPTCQTPPFVDDFIVLINGVEISFDEKLITDHYRYLEISVPKHQENPGYTLRSVQDIHKFHDIPFDADSKIVEILGSCLI